MSPNLSEKLVNYKNIFEEKRKTKKNVKKINNNVYK